MAYDLETRTTTGSNVHAIIRNSSAQVWSVSAVSYVAWVDANWAQYLVPLTEQGTSGFYYGSVPSGITQADALSVEIWSGPGTSESSDTFITGGTLIWTGSGAGGSYTGTALTNLTYAKDYAQIAVSTYDTFLTNRINAISAAIQSYCRRVFPVSNYVEFLDGAGSTELLLNQYPITGVTQIVTGYYTSLPQTIPGSALIVNARTGVVSVQPNSGYPTWFGYGNQAIQVTYSAGYSPIPADLQEACASMVKNAYLNAVGQTDVTLSMEKIGDYQRISRADVQKLLTDDIKDTLNQYKQSVI